LRQATTSSASGAAAESGHRNEISETGLDIHKGLTVAADLEGDITALGQPAIVAEKGRREHMETAAAGRLVNTQQREPELVYSPPITSTKYPDSRLDAHAPFQRTEISIEVRKRAPSAAAVDLGGLSLPPARQ
jgi:hypothetical protein